MVRRFAAILSLPAAVLVASAADAGERTRPGNQKPLVTAAAPAAKTAQPAPSADKPRHYASAKLGFTAAVPPGAEVVERKGTNQISIRSRKGYVINIQVGPKRPEVPLARMSALLEAQYLGEGRPWSARGEERPLRAFGLPAHDVVYRGNGSKARVVVARGRVNDYVFIFIASERSFPALEVEFEWALANFQPDARDRIRGQAVVQKAAAAPMTATGTAAQRFAEPGYGYAINYPATWRMSKPASMTAMFSGREGSPEYAAVIGIQNIAPPGARNSDEAARRAFNQLKASLGNVVRNFRVLEDRDWTYSRNGAALVGRQLLAVYEHAGVQFQKRMIAVPRPRGSVAHVWSYTAPRSQYASLQPHAERMLRSWTILTEDP